MITIYHNPRCSKSRQTLQLLQSKGIEPEIVLYLKHPLNHSTISNLLTKLGISASQLVRTSEPEFKDNFRQLELTEAQYIQAMVDYPKLIQRPIVELGERAVLGRPPENVLDLIS